MQSKIYKVLLASILAGSLAACTTPKLPAPTVQYPTPPAALMQTPEQLHTISTENK